MRPICEEVISNRVNNWVTALRLVAPKNWILILLPRQALKQACLPVGRFRVTKELDDLVSGALSFESLGGDKIKH